MKKIVLIIIAIGLMTMSSYSQEDVLRPKGRTDGGYSKSDNHPWAVGLEGGISYNMYSANLNWLPELPSPTLAVLESMNGLSPFFGVFVDYDFNKTFGIHTKFQYNSINHSNTNNGLRDLRDNFNLTYTTEIMELEYKESYNYLVLEPNLRINANEQLYFLIGPSFQFGTGNFKTEYTYTKEQNNVMFDNGTYVESGSGEVAFTENRLALNLAAGYKFEVGRNIFIAPQLSYHLGLSKFRDDYAINDETQIESQGGGLSPSILTITNQRLSNLRFSLTLWFENL